MTDLSEIADRDLILEIYRRIREEDEMSMYLNYCYRAAFRPVMVAFDKINIDESNIRMYQAPDWEKIDEELNDALGHLPD